MVREMSLKLTRGSIVLLSRSATTRASMMEVIDARGQNIKE